MNASRLVITGLEPTHTMIHEDTFMQRAELRTTHEEADISAVQQMIQLAPEDVRSI